MRCIRSRCAGIPLGRCPAAWGVSKYSLYKWVKLFGEPSPKPGVDHEAENRRLKRELARVTEERDILKKGNGVLRARVPMKYAFIRAHQDEFGVRAMCRVLRVHFSGFYAWLKEPLSHRAQEDLRHTELIRQAWTDSGKVYGYRKLTDDLRDQGECISENRVARLASLAGIAAQIGYRRRPGRLRRQARGRGREQAGTEVRDIRARSDLGHRHHLHQDPRGLAVPVCRHRSVLAPRRWLVRPVPHDDGPGAPSSSDGCLATKAV